MDMEGRPSCDCGPPRPPSAHGPPPRPRLPPMLPCSQCTSRMVSQAHMPRLSTDLEEHTSHSQWTLADTQDMLVIPTALVPVFCRSISSAANHTLLGSDHNGTIVCICSVSSCRLVPHVGKHGA